jgi:HEAT repeat protein
VLLDQLNDADRLVKRAAIQALGALGDAAAVPFLARLLGEGADEEIQLAAIAALGRIGSPEALPSLMGVANRRSLFGGKKMGRARSAAVQAIGKIGTQGAREVLHSIAAGKDADLAEEARRALSVLE